MNRLYENKPVYTLDHIVKERSAVWRPSDSLPQCEHSYSPCYRYPSFVDALRDIDDALSMLFLFSMLPQRRRLQVD